MSNTQTGVDITQLVTAIVEAMGGLEADAPAEAPAPTQG